MAGTAAPFIPRVQVTLWDLLGEEPVEMRRPPKPASLPPVPSVAVETIQLAMREPTLQEKCFVHEALAAIIPPGVPIYAKMIVAVVRIDKDRLIADVKLFDDAIGRVQISGPKGSHGYRWHHCGVPGTAFHWNEGTRRWERIPEVG